MSLPLFALAMKSPGRQLAFRRVVVLHLAITSILAAAMFLTRFSAAWLGQAMLILAIVEGAALVGWRLVQLPKSQALEFLLVSPLQPWRVFLIEALAGAGRLMMVTLAGLPVLLFLTFTGKITLDDMPALISAPLLCGLLSGFGLTAWAYETISIRRWGERLAIVGLVIYLVVGVLAAERIGVWLQRLPPEFSRGLLTVILAMTQYNPFSAIGSYLSLGDTAQAEHRLHVVHVYAALAIAACVVRATWRFKGHFHDRHYRPIAGRKQADATGIGDRPLSWWAVRRVMEYSGRLNIWIAGAFGALYALFIIAGDHWPTWLGRLVFEIFESCGGIPVFSTALVVMAAVPAAFQYGLWDSSTAD
jgi:hypothetical protein